MSIAGYNKRVSSFVVDTTAGSVGTFYLMTVPTPGMRLHGASVAAERTTGADGSNYLNASLINGGSVGESTDLLGHFGGASVGLSALRPYALNLGDHASEVAGGSVLIGKYSFEGSNPSRLTLALEWTQGG